MSDRRFRAVNEFLTILETKVKLPHERALEIVKLSSEKEKADCIHELIRSAQKEIRIVTSNPIFLSVDSTPC